MFLCFWSRQPGPLGHLEKPHWVEQPCPGSGSGKDLFSSRASQLLKFILLPVVMTIICTHSQWSQGESCRWNGSWFRDVFPPVLFNVRFSHFPHLRNKNVKQQSQRKGQLRHQCLHSGNAEEKLLGGICCMGEAEPERQMVQGLGESMWRELTRDGKGYSSKVKGFRTKILSLVTRLMLCMQWLGRSHCHLLQNHLTMTRIRQENQQLAWTKEKGPRQSYTKGQSQHLPSAPRAACELLQCLGPWSDPLSRACNETLGKH